MPKRRTIYAWTRFALFLGREFRWPALVFWSLVLLGGLGLSLFYHREPIGYGRACYAVFCMIFFEMGVVEFPREWYLQPFFFLVPIVGLGAVADSVVRLGYFVFTSKQKLPEWHRMNASAMRNHIVLCGVGKVGYRILEELLAMKEDVVAIEKEGGSPLVADMIGRGVTVIIGEARLRKTLEEANVAGARALICATNDDLANIDAGLTAREIKPGLRVVLRLFDDTLARRVAPVVNMPAISTSSSSASAFVCAVTERNIFQSIQLGPRKLHVADLIVGPGSRLTGRTVGDVQQECGVNIVMQMSDGKSDVNPPHASVLKPENHLIVIAELEAVTRLEELNR